MKADFICCFKRNSSRTRSFRWLYSASLIILLCTGSIIIAGVNLKPVKADVTASITNVEFPALARSRSTIQGRIDFIYSADEDVDLEFRVRDTDVGRFVGRAERVRINVAEGTTVEDAEGFIIYHFQARASEWVDEPEGPFMWHLEAYIVDHGERIPFTITVTPHVSDYFRVTAVELLRERTFSYMPADIPEEIYAGHSYHFAISYEYCLPRDSRYKLTIRDVTQDEILPPISNRLDGSGVSSMGLSSDGPPLWERSYEWVLLFEPEFIRPEDDDWRASAPFEKRVHVEVSPQNWIHLVDTRYPSAIARGEELTVLVECEYSWLEEVGPGTVRLSLRDDEGTVDMREWSDLTGIGRIHETLYLEPPPDIDRWELMIDIRILEGGARGDIPDDWYYVDREISVDIMEEEEFIERDLDHWAKIDRLTVNGMPPDPPVDISVDEDLEIQVTVSWHFPCEEARRAIHIFIEDQHGLTRIVADQYDEVEWLARRSENSDVYTLTVPLGIAEFSLSPWDLRAYVLHSRLDLHDVSYINAGYEERFTVNLPDVETSDDVIDVNLDWAVTRAWVTPVEPYLGVDATFGAEIMFETEGTVEYPINVMVSRQLDDEAPVIDTVPFESGDPQPVTSLPWTTTSGTHTVRWEVDPEGDYTDDNLANNVFELTFTVQDEPPLPPDWEPPPPEEPGWEPPVEEDGVTADGEGVPVEEEFDFYVTASPDEQVLASSISYTVTVEHVSGPPNPVQIDVLGVPTAVSYMVDPPSGNPSYTATMTVTAASSLPAGVYPLTIKAVGDGKERYKTVTFIVEEGPAYQLQAQPSSNQTFPGGTAGYTLTITSDNGYTQYVNLRVSGLPHGVTGRLEPSAERPDFQSTLSLEVDEDVDPGVYSFMVSGSGVDPQRVRLTLIVREADAQQPIDGVGKGRPVSYYLPLLYLAAILAVIVAGSILAVRYVKGRVGRPKSYCIECGRKIPVGSEFCTECGARQTEG